MSELHEVVQGDYIERKRHLEDQTSRDRNIKLIHLSPLYDWKRIHTKGELQVHFNIDY